MYTAFLWLIRIFLGLAMLALLTVVVLYYILTRSIPDYSGTVEVRGITAPVEIVRSNANVPHIFGQTDADVFFALGYVHAQDRLWQMTMLRRTAQGRLSEIFGERTLKIDELLRRLDLYTLSLSSVAVQDEETTVALAAYAQGVNAWIAQVNEQALGRGAPEFFLFSGEIAAWQPADSIAIIKLMALQLSSHLEAEVLRAQVSLAVSPDQVLDILPDDPGQGVTALPPYGAVVPGVAPGAPRIRLADDPLSPVHGLPFAGASNAWAAMPQRSAARGTLLANDPHLGFTAPAIWYLARLELSSGGVIGGTIPGIPAILVGRSERLGWGLTTAYVDDQDVVLERVNPEDEGAYAGPDGWTAFIERRSIITVKDAAPVTVTLRWSQAGPVLPGDVYELGSVTPPGHVAALAWTALDGADTSMTAALRIMRARTVSEAIAAGELYVAPAQNLMLADSDGIAMQVIGRIPERDARHQTAGRMPAPGEAVENRWLGVFPYAQNLRVVNPVSGLLGNTNNKTVDAPFPRHVSFLWGDTHRIQRWLTLMGTREVHTRESFIEAQLDTVSPTARALLPLIGSELWFTGPPAADGTPERQRQQALDMLAAWNGEMNEHLPEPLIAEAWLRKLQVRLIRDELGPLADSFTHVDPVFIERVFRDIDGAGRWCDVVQSAAIETCAEISRLALDEALLWLNENRGAGMESWRWGDAHQATHDHPVLGDVPFLRLIVNIRQSTSGGDTTLMRGRTAGTDPEPFLNVHGAGYRGVYDFADPDSSVFIISTGQSGHPLSRHYDDLGTLWRRGEYIPMSLDPDLPRAASVGVTVLEPAD